MYKHFTIYTAVQVLKYNIIMTLQKKKKKHIVLARSLLEN